MGSGLWNSWREGGLAPKNAKLSPAQRDEIVERKRKGESPMDLAKEFGVTASYIRQV